MEVRGGGRGGLGRKYSDPTQDRKCDTAKPSAALSSDKIGASSTNLQSTHLRLNPVRIITYIFLFQMRWRWRDGSGGAPLSTLLLVAVVVASAESVTFECPKGESL